MQEIWKDLIYQGKNYGDRLEVSNIGKIRNKLTGTVYKLNTAKNGYLRTYISLGSRNNGKLFKVHKAVAETFIPNDDNTLIINHIDGNKLNNNLDNLEWCTQSHNIKHAFDTGLNVTKKGCDNWQSKLTKEDIEFIRNHYKPRDKAYGSRALGRRFNIDHMQILKIINKVTYKNI